MTEDVVVTNAMNKRFGEVWPQLLILAGIAVVLLTLCAYSLKNGR